MGSSENNYESDYAQSVDTGITGVFLPGTAIEIIREPAGRGGYRHVLFDFDGTLSLIREGWPGIMIPMMVECLIDTPDHEPKEVLEHVVREYVMRLTGKQTIYQMIQLAQEVKKRGGTPSDPLEYKRTYHDRLMHRIGERREALRSGRVVPEEMLVPGTVSLLEELLSRGLSIYLASGTDEAFVKEEADLLRLTKFFGKHVYGALDDFRSFSKAMVIKRILQENRVDGHRLLGFGDAYVEIDNVKSVGGCAVGVASDEAGRSGAPDPWKRDRLIGVGADVIIPDFRERDQLMEYLFPGEP